jgi:hypothetical protein
MRNAGSQSNVQTEYQVAGLDPGAAAPAASADRPVFHLQRPYRRTAAADWRFVPQGDIERLIRSPQQGEWNYFNPRSFRKFLALNIGLAGGA